MKKVLACLLAMTFAFLFVACGDKTEGNETTTDPSAVTTTDPNAVTTTTDPNATTVTTDPNATTTTDPNATTVTTDPNAPTTTTNPGDTTTQAPNNNVTTTQGTTPAPNPGNNDPTKITVPTDTAGIIALYNSALGKTSMQRTAHKRTMTKVTAVAKLIGVITLIEDNELHNNKDVQQRANVNETKTVASDLVALNANQVASATSSVSGNTATLTINLKRYEEGGAGSAQSGALGYVSTINEADVITLVKDVAFTLGGEMVVAIDDIAVKIGLSDGKYVVTIDTTTGKITSVTHTGAEFGSGTAKVTGQQEVFGRKVKVPNIPANVTLAVTLESKYSAK